jgi:hypothetical protein
MTLEEARAKVIAVMEAREPGKKLDPDNVEFTAELLVELFKRGMIKEDEK